MRINIRFDNPLVISAPGIERELCKIADALNAVAEAIEHVAETQEPEKAKSLNPSFSEEPLT